MSTQTSNAGRAGHARDADHGRVQQLADDGLGRNAIARELGVSRRAVDNAATALGITWSREQTAKATRARLADVQSELSHVLGDVAAVAGRRLLAELDKPQPDHNLIRSYAYSAGIASDKIFNLAARVGTETTDAGTAAIRIFSTSLDKAYAELTSNNDTTPEETK